MPKDFIPCDIYRLNELIEEYKKIKNMTDKEEEELFFKLLHNNFCRYIIKKGPKKNTICLNKFKDINDLKYCHTHRLEVKPWLACKTLFCNGKTKVDYCRNCKKTNKLINVSLPIQDEKEILDLSNEYINYVIIETVIPNAKYRIKNYHLHDYYKVHTIHMNLIMPSYDEKGNKIKKIKSNEYLKYYKHINKNKFLKDLYKDIDDYNVYNDFNMKILYITTKILIRIKKIKKKYISIEKVCNIPLPPVSIDEEILLNTNLNELYEKKVKNKKDSYDKVLVSDISKNNIQDEKDEKYNLFYKIFEKKCNVCHSYKRFIMDICKVNFKLYNVLINTFNDVNNYNLIKINEIFDIFKKPKIKPANVNKIYNDLPRILNYGKKIDDLIKIEIKELCKISYIVYDDIDKSIINDIIGNKFAKYLFD